ncbi:uncharacterized protein LOC143290882 [Babylonia areolata]|uniref:uncharacterized protein LOC143290882 n=1 Tax=Babylonia areolata TaxID=304850 RepID=UPI003FCF438C
MAEYKPRQYTSKTLDYNTRIPAKNLDTRIKLYEPSRPITRDIPPTRTYNTKPPKNIKVRTYDKIKTYDSYAEYVPPWSRGKEKGKKNPPPPPKPQTRKEEAKKKEEAKTKTEKKKEVRESPRPKETKVMFAPLPPVVEKESSLPALGSVKRMMELFGV